MRGWWRQLPPSGNPSRIVPLPYPWARNRGKPTNVSSWQVPTAICCGTKPATKGIITGFILRRCPFPIGCDVLELAERDRLSSGNRNHGGQSLPDGGPFGRRHSLHRTVSAGDDRHGTFSSASRYSVCLFSAGRYGVDVEVAFYLPVDASPRH